MKRIANVAKKLGLSEKEAAIVGVVAVISIPVALVGLYLVPLGVGVVREACDRRTLRRLMRAQREDKGLDSR